MKKLSAIDNPKRLPVHPAAQLFPLMPEPQLTELAADIKANGLVHPIVTFDGQVLDGRNRLAACDVAGVRPRLEEWSGESPTAYVLSANSNRRHLTASQRAMIAANAATLIRKERGTTKSGRPKNGAGRHHSAKGKSAALAAKSVGAGERTVARALALKKAAPELAKEVLAGKKTLDQADRAIRRGKQLEQVKAYLPPAGEFSVIVDDPAWPFDDKLEGVGRELPYPVETIEAICSKPPPAAKDCVLFLWTTNAHLIDGSALRVLQAWGFEPKALLTWGKDRIGLGRYVRNCTEQCVISVKGSPVVNLDGIPAAECSSLLIAPAGAHSAKPEKFYALVERICPSTSRLELHARTSRPGWTCSGAEAPKDEPKTATGIRRKFDLDTMPTEAAS